MQHDILEARVGTTVGGAWRIDRLVGVGGMAAVYSATHIPSGRRAAFKVLHREHAADSDARARFLGERDIVAQIEHEDRLEVLGIAQMDDGVPVLIMELLEGETLAAYWQRRGRVSLPRALRIAERLLDFLVACHATGVIHRDLKPANVFLTADGKVKVLDFGVARASRRSVTKRRLALGTPAYMSPEQANGASERVSASSDLFAVGAILWSILSGHTLRIAKNSDLTLEIARRDPARSLGLVAPEMPAPAVRLVDRALEADPANRWRSASEMHAEVVRILATVRDEPISIPPVPPSDRPTLPVVPSSIRALEGSRPTLVDVPTSVKTS